MYRRADMRSWQGRDDASEGEDADSLRWHQVVKPLALDDAAHEGARTAGIALLGFSCDAGVARNHGRPGAKDGPAAIRAMLANLPVRRRRPIADAGDIVCESDALEQAQAALSAAVAGLLARGALPLVMGGGHEMAFGSFGGLADHVAAMAHADHPPAIGIVNLDAHFDLRMADRATSGTPFRQIAEDCAGRGWPFHYCCLGISDFANTEALFQRAKALGVQWRMDEDMDIVRLPDTLAFLARFLKSVEHVYLTICLDVLPAAVAPGVSAPAARGVALDVIEPLIDAVCASGKLRIADIAEFNPRYDIDARTARVAARLIARAVQNAS